MKPASARFLTRSRSDLFDLSRRLFSAIGDEFLTNGRHPLIVCVNGSQKAGKRIVTDAAMEVLFDGEPAMDGKCNHDEYWTGRRNGKRMEVDFIDAAYNFPVAYSHRIPKPALTLPDDFPDMEQMHYETVSTFLDQREYGGVSFLQNSSFRGGHAHIRIEIESRMGYRVDEQTEKFQKERKPLRETFNMVFENSREWARFVRIDVHDRKLIESQKFADAFAAFAPACAYKPRQTTLQKLRNVFFTSESTPVPSGCEPPVYVYGNNFPLPS